MGGISELVSYFPPAREVVPTTGIQAGVILKYYGYYLKIYHRLASDYTIIGYRYNDNQALFIHDVESCHIRAYANAFSPTNIPTLFPYARLGKIE